MDVLEKVSQITMGTKKRPLLATVKRRSARLVEPIRALSLPREMLLPFVSTRLAFRVVKIITRPLLAVLKWAAERSPGEFILIAVAVFWLVVIIRGLFFL